MFSQTETPDLTGKVAIVTGPKGGIGLETACVLARAGCIVYLAGRGDLNPIIKTIRSQPGLSNASLHPLQLDLSSTVASLAGAAAFPKESRLDILIANAAISLDGHTTVSDEGWERQFQTNQIGNFAFVTSLLPAVQRTAEQYGEARIVILGSSTYRLHGPAPLDYEALRTAPTAEEMGFVAGIKRYATSKLAQMIFARELSKRLLVAGKSNIYVNCVHPGTVGGTGLGGMGEQIGIPRWVGNIVHGVQKMVNFSIKDGAMASIFAATSKEIVEKNLHGEYFEPIIGWTLGYVGLTIPELTGVVKSPEEGVKLWEVCEKAVYGNVGALRL